MSKRQERTKKRNELKDNLEKSVEFYVKSELIKIMEKKSKGDERELKKGVV